MAIAGGDIVVFGVEQIRTFPPGSLDAQVNAHDLGWTELLITCDNTVGDTAGIERGGTSVSARLTGFR